MGSMRSQMFDTNLQCNFVIQCRIGRGTVPEVVYSKSEPELGSKRNFLFERKIPDELLIEILIRLPSKCVCRYRAVNKHWRNLISSNHFIDRHVTHLRDLNGSHFIPDSFTLVFQDKICCPFPPVGVNNYPLLEPLPLHSDLVMCKSYNCLDFIPPLKQSSKSKPKSRYSKLKHGDTVPSAVLASCRDLLLCCRLNKVPAYYVVNIVTRQLMVLPSAPLFDQEQQPAKNRRRRKPGLVCYDDSSDGGTAARGWCRFKVVLVSGPPELGSSVFTLRIFCSESGEWTKLMVDWYPRTTQTDYCTSQMVPHNGRLHWVNGHSLVSLDLFNGDPNTRKLKLSRMIDLPDGIVSNFPYKLGVSQGHLCVATVHHGSTRIQVWQVEDDYHSKTGLWQLLYHTVLPFPRYTALVNVAAFHPYNRDAIFVHIGHCVYLLDLKNAELDRYVEMKVNDANDRGRVLHMISTQVVRHQWFPTPLPSSCPLPDPPTSSSSS